MQSAEQLIDDLLETVKELPPNALAEFTARLAEWQETPGDGGPPESFLLRQTRRRMTARDAKRLRDLAGWSERGELNPSELEEYRQLALKSERIAATRVQALAELARRRKQSVSQVKQDIGWREVHDGA
ncbi:MAG TPA: hypothetical protein VML55_23625 [Planctomycetaceae bacterium]|nr:hypothetical protein [Planctomycetaceae bacterium]